MLNKLQAQQAQMDKNRREERAVQRTEASQALADQLERMGAQLSARHQQALSQSKRL